MTENTGRKLAGRTAFITGASRGIGKAIALKLARDGANIVIAAKTAEPHPKLPGTIYTAAKEVEEAGGRVLPCIADIRFEDQVERAVAEAVKTFGGIDILVNNASAISLTGTLQTPMKRYDLMNGINARGTYLCSRACLPYLKKGTNPHILNISPPLNMAAGWFKDYAAYTIAKYGMSLCALGMAAEFQENGIAVNTLWPRTVIQTAAIGFGSEMASHCRHPAIMADAAYVILTRNSRSFTGNFCMDDEVLVQSGVGVRELEKYSCVPGAQLRTDLFVDVSADQFAQQVGTTTPVFYKDVGSSDAERSSSALSVSGPGLTVRNLERKLTQEVVKQVKGVCQFDLTGKDAGTWYLDLKNGDGAVGSKKPGGGEADCILTMDSDVFTDLFAGKAQLLTLLAQGSVKISGDRSLAKKLQVLLPPSQKSKL